MSVGLLAVVDDILSAALKASAKTAGVVIDDAAVTPQYVQGLTPARELPVVLKIARGSLINKFFIIIPIALLLTAFVDARLLAHFDATKRQWRIAGGAYQVRLATDAVDLGLATTVDVPGMAFEP